MLAFVGKIEIWLWATGRHVVDQMYQQSVEQQQDNLNFHNFRIKFWLISSNHLYITNKKQTKKKQLFTNKQQRRAQIQFRQNLFGHSAFVHDY